LKGGQYMQIAFL